MKDWLRRIFGPSAVAVQADRGAVAAGRDIHGSTIKIGVGEEEIQRRIEEAQRPLVGQIQGLAEQIARDKGLPVDSLKAVLAKLGQEGVPDHEILKRLDFFADQFLQLRTMLNPGSNDRVEFIDLRRQVLALIDAGNFDDARIALRRGQEEARRLGLISEEVQTTATEGRVEQLELNYVAAAAKYGEAARLVHTIDPDGVWGLLMEQADALTLQGTELGDGDALVDAIAIYRRCLTLAPRPKRPLDWGNTQNALGVALSRLGERQEATACFIEAVEAFQETLKECTRERVPLVWAAAKRNIGNALTAIGERETGTASFEASLVLYEEALEECTRDRMPLEWASIQNNIATAVQNIGKRERNAEKLRQSVSHYEAALLERTRNRTPLDWALTQNNLGNTLSLLAQLEQNFDYLRASIACFVEALKERTIERVPLDWAMTTTNLGMGFAKIGAVSRNRQTVESGRDAVRAALEVFEQLGAERYVAGNQRNLMLIEFMLGEMR